MEKKSQKEMIAKLSEGNMRKVHLLIEVDGKAKHGCGCCICSPNVRGAGDETAKQDANFNKLADDVMVVVGSIITKT